MRRKAHGAAFATFGNVRREDLRWVAGEDDLARYESSPGGMRTFCRRCGASLHWYRDGEEIQGITLGVLDDDSEVRVEHHIFTDHRTPWFEITGDLPQYPGDDE